MFAIVDTQVMFYTCSVCKKGAWGGATSRTVPGSIPGGVTGFFSDIFLPTVPWPWGPLSL